MRSSKLICPLEVVLALIVVLSRASSHSHISHHWTLGMAVSTSALLSLFIEPLCWNLVSGIVVYTFTTDLLQSCHIKFLPKLSVAFTVALDFFTRKYYLASCGTRDGEVCERHLLNDIPIHPQNL